MIRDVQAAAGAKGVQLKILNAGTETEIDTALASLASLRVDALVIGDDPFFVAQQKQLVALASRYLIPTAYQFREFAAAGRLVSYGPSLAAAIRQAGVFAGKIVKVPNRPTCRSSSRPSSSWSSTCGPQRRSASRCRRRCSPAPTR